MARIVQLETKPSLQACS